MSRRHTSATRWFFAGCFFLGVLLVRGQETNTAPIQTALPDLGSAVLRMIGSLIFVLAIFLCGVWLLKRWQGQGAVRSGRPAKLRILETRHLGARQALHVVGYEKQRLLVSSSPSGISFLSQLPAAELEEESGSGEGPAPATFMETLQVALGRKKS